MTLLALLCAPLLAAETIDTNLLNSLLRARSQEIVRYSLLRTVERAEAYAEMESAAKLAAEVIQAALNGESGTLPRSLEDALIAAANAVQPACCWAGDRREQVLAALRELNNLDEEKWAKLIPCAGTWSTPKRGCRNGDEVPNVVLPDKPITAQTKALVRTSIEAGIAAIDLGQPPPADDPGAANYFSGFTLDPVTTVSHISREWYQRAGFVLYASVGMGLLDPLADDVANSQEVASEKLGLALRWFPITADNPQRTLRRFELHTGVFGSGVLYSVSTGGQATPTVLVGAFGGIGFFGGLDANVAWVRGTGSLDKGHWMLQLDLPLHDYVDAAVGR